MSNEEEKQPEVTEEKEAEATEEKEAEAAEEKEAEEAAHEEEEAAEEPAKKEDKPDFERVKDHKFEKGEKVYMIDPNEFDLWEGEIEKVDGDNYSIHYPDFPQDDETVEGTLRILVRSDKNKEIYNNQEEIRHLKEEDKEEEEEEVNEKKDKKKKKNKK